MRLLIILACALGLALPSCFTGVESTPKIGYSEVKRQQIEATPEMKFLSEIAPQPPAQWQRGKRFFISDPRAGMVFTSQSTANLDSIAGITVAFESFRPVRAVTGSDVVEAVFSTPAGELLYFRDNLPFSDLQDKQTLEVPFTIDMDMVDAARQQMQGKRYYIVTPLWYTPDGSEATNGLRHVAVDIADVQPGNASYPVRVLFTAEGDSALHSVFMTLGPQRSSTRNFHTLFAFDNPKEKYPYIKNDVWQLIQHSRVREGMSRDECRLALGNPQTRGTRPTHAGMEEYWQYSDGTFLVFEEGFLSKLR